MTLETVAHLQTVAQPLFISQPQLEFDLRGVSRSDSSALALLALWTRQAKTLNKKISFENLPQQLVEIAQLCGLEKILPLM
jgi:ABC-type transporter Mla MlaB component